MAARENTGSSVLSIIPLGGCWPFEGRVGDAFCQAD